MNKRATKDQIALSKNIQEHLNNKNLEDLINVLKENEIHINEVHIAMIMNRIGKNKYFKSDVVIEIIIFLTPKIDEIEDFNGQNIGNAVYGLQNMSDCEEFRLFLKALSPKIDEIEDFKGQEILMILNGIFDKGYFIDKEILFRKLESLFIDNNFDDIFVLESYKTYMLHEIEIPDFVDKAYKKIVSKSISPASYFELNVLEFIKAKHPNLNIKNNIYVDGYELDIYLDINGTKYNIELDGNLHKITGDKKRDKYLEEKHDIKVFRCKTGYKSV